MDRGGVETVACDLHGSQPMTFVCTHIAHALLDGASCGFVIAPEEGEAYPMAWCDACEEMVIAQGGDWTEEASSQSDFKMFCASCYLDARDLAHIEGGFRDLTRGDGPRSLS